MLNITVESEFNGGDTDLIYSIRITDENDDIVYETNSTTNVIVIGLDNGDYNITVWAINIYGVSDSITETVTIDVFIWDVTSTSVIVTVATTGTVESTSSNGLIIIIITIPFIDDLFCFRCKHWCYHWRCGWRCGSFSSCCSCYCDTYYYCNSEEE